MLEVDDSFDHTTKEDFIEDVAIRKIQKISNNVRRCPMVLTISDNAYL